jgi:hypothetical protein
MSTLTPRYGGAGGGVFEEEHRAQGPGSLRLLCKSLSVVVPAEVEPGLLAQQWFWIHPIRKRCLRRSCAAICMTKLRLLVLA